MEDRKDVVLERLRQPGVVSMIRTSTADFRIRRGYALNHYGFGIWARQLRAFRGDQWVDGPAVGGIVQGWPRWLERRRGKILQTPDAVLAEVNLAARSLVWLRQPQEQNPDRTLAAKLGCTQYEQPGIKVSGFQFHTIWVGDLNDLIPTQKRLEVAVGRVVDPMMRDMRRLPERAPFDKGTYVYVGEAPHPLKVVVFENPETPTEKRWGTPLVLGRTDGSGWIGHITLSQAGKQYVRSDQRPPDKRILPEDLQNPFSFR